MARLSLAPLGQIVMDNLLSSPIDNHSSNNKDASEADRSHSIPPQPEQLPAPVRSIPQSIFDRLNASLDKAQTEGADSQHLSTLVELGIELRQWRLQQGYTRALLARKLQIDEEHLLCIENGIAEADQISKAPLLTLQALLNDDEVAQSLSAAIHRYLALPKP